MEQILEYIIHNKTFQLKSDRNQTFQAKPIDAVKSVPMLELCRTTTVRGTCAEDRGRIDLC